MDDEDFNSDMRELLDDIEEKKRKEEE
jgi:hypothetical protein